MSEDHESVLATPAKAHEHWLGAVWIPTADLKFCAWNVNEMTDGEFSELVEEIRAYGFDEPLDVVPCAELEWHPDDDGYIVAGGAHRLKALHSLERDRAPCVIKHELCKLDEKEFMMWTVRRNNLRGRINKERYSALERRLKDRWGLAAEAARQRMMIKDQIREELRDNADVVENEEDGVDGADQGRGDGERSRLSKEERDLRNALRVVEKEVLLESADTVEHGYLAFAQGSRGQVHLVVDMPKRLFTLVSEMVDLCKSDSARVDEFLTSAITKEVKEWQ